MPKRPLRRHLTAAGAVLAVTAAILPVLPAGATIADPRAAGTSALDATYDVRRAAEEAQPTQAQRDAVATILKGAPGGRATWDGRFGTPRSVFGGASYLTSARSGSAEEVARAWISDNRAAFGMSPAAVEALKVQRNHALPGTGTRVVTFAQVFDGVPAVRGGRLTVAVTKDGRVLSYAGDPTRGDALAG